MNGTSPEERAATERRSCNRGSGTVSRGSGAAASPRFGFMRYDDVRENHIASCQSRRAATYEVQAMENCSNCERAIGNLEPACVYRERVVCEGCYQKLLPGIHRPRGRIVLFVVVMILVVGAGLSWWKFSKAAAVVKTEPATQEDARVEQQIAVAKEYTARFEKLAEVLKNEQDPDKVIAALKELKIVHSLDLGGGAAVMDHTAWKLLGKQAGFRDAIAKLLAAKVYSVYSDAREIVYFDNETHEVLGRGNILNIVLNP
jgi:hypothetical protein